MNHEPMADDVCRRETDEVHVLDLVEDLLHHAKPALHPAGKVDLVLGAIPCEQISCARANRPLKDGELAFSAVRKLMGNEITVEYKLTVDGDKLKGKGAVERGGQTTEFDIAGKREKKDK